MRLFEKSRSMVSRLRSIATRMPARRVRMLVEELEPRILHSADIGPALLHDGAVAPQVETRVLDAGGEFATQAMQSQQAQTELVIVDTRTPDYQKLVDDIRSEAAGGRQIEVVLLDNRSNGIDQITALLSGRKDIGAVHLISHGSEGAVQLGGSVLDLQSLRAQAGEIESWANALTQDADLLIYGCNVAGSPDGRTLIDALSRLTGADVAASDNLTGNAALGGDWNLEYSTGHIDAALAIDAQTRLAWAGVLANASPVLSGANNLTSIAEDPATNPGTLVSALLAGHVTDADGGALTGIAVTAADNTNGSWQFSIDAGGSWSNLNNPSDTTARLLRSTDFVRFVPNADFNGTVNNGLTFRAWDQTSGTAGGTADTLSTTSTVLDTFSSTSYTNNDGTAAWSAGWVDTDGNPAAGNVQITGGQLQFTVVLGGGTIFRQADLTGATSATLSLSYDNQFLIGLGGNVVLQISNNGGSSYTTLHTFSQSNTGTGTLSFDIGAYIAPNTRIQFVAGGIAIPQVLGVDDVQISYVTPLASGVTAFSSATASSSIVVSAVNDAPAGTSNTVTTNEDAAYVFSTADFGFSDAHDTPANNFLAVKITTLPGAGSLTLNGLAVTAGQSVLASDIAAGDLVFSPAADGNGSSYASFTFQVQDDGGGTDLDATARTMTIDVTSVNDAPAGTSNTVTAAEDGSHVFSTTDFGFSDTTDTPANNLLAVKITTLPGAGSLTLSGIAVTTGQFVAASDIVAGNLVFTPAAGTNGAGYASFTFQVQDDGGGVNNLDPTARVMTIDVTAVNDPPVGANNTVTATEDGSYTFGTADFGFSDPGDTPGNNLLAIKITTLPGAGSLTLGGVAVTAGQSISAADVIANSLKFSPAANGNGTGYASFTFQVQDDGGGTDLDVTARTMTINVTAVNDPPAGTSNTVTAAEDGSHVFSTADFGFTDPADTPANTFLAVKIASLPGTGSLTLNGIAVTAGQFVAASDITLGELVFTPAAGASGTGYASFTFQVQDNGSGADLDPTARTMTIDVTAVNDPPAGANNTVTTTEDNAYTFGTADFGFSDPGDTPANNLLAVKISTLPGAGSLTLSGVAVTAGQFVSSVDIALGNLQFTPAADANGTGYASFTFQVQDDGGGTDLDATARTMTINVTAVNDAPVLAANAGVTTNEGASAVITTASLHVTDIDSTAAQLVFSVTATPSNGHIELTSATGVAITSFTQDDIDNNRVVYVHDGSQTTADGFSFSVTDGAGGNIGATAFAITITAVNDAPVNSVPGTQATSPGTALVFSTAGGNAIAISDADAGAGSVQVSLSASNGAMTLATTAGLTFIVGTGTGDTTMQFSGTVAAINAALDGSSFTPGTGFIGTAALSIVTDDLGNTGIGGPLTANSAVNISVAAQPPVATPVIPILDPPPGPIPVPPVVVADPVLPPTTPAPVTDSPAPTFDEVPSAGGTVEPDAAAVIPADIGTASSRNASYSLTAPSSRAGRAFGVSFTLPATQWLLYGDEPAAGLTDATAASFGLGISGDARSSLQSPALIDALDRLREGLQEQSRADALIVATTAAASLGLSVGYVLWLLRGGVLISSMLSSLPAWRLVDPLPILGRLDEDDDEDEDDSIESLLAENNAAPVAPPAPPADLANKESVTG